MEDLKGKIALVTGGGSGINLAFVKLLYSAGCNILIADLSLHREAQTWLASIPTAGRIEFQRTDVTDWSQLERTITACSDKFNCVPDIIVPGAGIYEPSTNSFWNDLDEASHYRVLDVNLVHPLKLSRIAIRALRRSGKSGTIVLISSIAGQRSSIVTPLYTASKHGVNSFIRGMAPLWELAGIRVVGVAPGTVGSPLFTEHPEALKFLDTSKDLLLPPEAIARAMFALLTDPSYKPGTVLEVCDIDKWREVALLNDPGPSGPASTSSRKSEAIEDVKAFLEQDRMST